MIRKEFAHDFLPSSVHFVRCDVTSESSLTSAVASACSFFSVDQLDLLVNNAGVMGEREGWRLCMAINLNGLLQGSMHVMEK